MDEIEYIVFSGGGMRGGAFCSGLELLNRIWHALGIRFFDRIQGCAGTSIGSLAAFMVTSGYHPKQMCMEYKRTNLKSNEEFIQLWEQKSYLDSTVFRSHVKRVVANRGAFETNVTFSQHHDLTGKDLVIVATCLNTYQAIYFSYKTTPDVEICDALYASCAIPGYLPHVTFELGGQPCTFIDGAYSDNFPFHLFPRQKTLGMWLAPENNYEPVATFQEVVIHSMLCALTNLDVIKHKVLNAEPRIITIHVPFKMSMKCDMTARDYALVLYRGQIDTVAHLLQYFVIPFILKHLIQSN